MPTKEKQYAIYLDEVHYYAWKCPVCGGHNESVDDPRPTGSIMEYRDVVFLQCSCGWHGTCEWIEENHA